MVSNAKSGWAKQRADLADRVSFAGGDFFNAQTLPKPANVRTVYIMRCILHEWDDSSSIKILQALATVMAGSRSKLVLIEQVACFALHGPQGSSHCGTCISACECSFAIYNLMSIELGQAHPQRICMALSRCTPPVLRVHS